jgi:hypothetical protein
MTRRRHDLISGTPKEPLTRQLYRVLAGHVAERLGCCPIHGTTLICALCDMVWTGSDSEFTEVEALLDRTALHHMTWRTWPCARCDTQDAAMCAACYGHIREPEALAGLAPEEDARLRVLLGTSLRRMGRTDPDGAAGAEQVSHGG